MEKNMKESYFIEDEKYLRDKLKNILSLKIEDQLNTLLEILDLKNKEEIELVSDDIFDFVVKIARVGDIEKTAILGIKCFKRNDPNEIRQLRGILWNRNNIPISLFITPTDVILNNNFSIKDGFKFLNSLEKRGKLDFILLKYENLINGKFIEACEKIVKSSDRVDQKLLINIKAALRLLCEKGTSFDNAHDILSKSIFIKYLEDRKILTEKTYNKFGVKDYKEILVSKNLNEFLMYLENKFKGNIFYNNSSLLEKYEADIIIDFLNGTELNTGQLCLYGYDFSIIPIELISNIYELFLSEEDIVAKKNNGAFYTPYFLANAMIENIQSRILKKSYRILDPSCGSGVFLVSCFKKLVSLQTCRSHAKLISILKESIFGVDINAQALKITRISLYIALLDCFNPKDIEENEIYLPDLNNNLNCKDFFSEKLVFDQKFDLIIGNPPWSSILTEDCKKYLDVNHKDVISDSQLCQSFILRTKDFLLEDGVASILISNGILYNSLANRFRKEMFKHFSIVEIMNLQRLRASLFQNAKYPCSVITYVLKSKNESLCDYINIEKDFIDVLQNKIAFDKSNAQQISSKVMKKYDYIWSILHEGNKLDFELINLIRENGFTIDKYILKHNLKISQGYSAGDKENKEFLDLKHCESSRFSRFKIDYDNLTNNTVYRFERLHNIEQYFCKYKLLIKRSIRDKRPECAFINNQIFFRNDFYSIFTNEERIDELLFLEAILNSDIYNYYQFHMAPSYNKTSQPEIRMDSIKDFPLPVYTKNSFLNLISIVKKIHKELIKFDALQIKNINEKQISFLYEHSGDTCNYISLLESLNKEVYKLYGLDDKDIAIIKYSLKYCLKEKNMDEIVDSTNVYNKTLKKLIKQLIPKKYNVYVNYYEGKFFKIILFEFSQKENKTDLQRLLELILKTYEMSSINQLFNNIALRKNFIGTFTDGVFIIKNKKEENWQEAVAYLDFSKIEKILLMGGNNE